MQRNRIAENGNFMVSDSISLSTTSGLEPSSRMWLWNKPLFVVLLVNQCKNWASDKWLDIFVDYHGTSLAGTAYTTSPTVSCEVSCSRRWGMLASVAPPVQGGHCTWFRWYLLGMKPCTPQSPWPRARWRESHLIAKSLVMGWSNPLRRINIHHDFGDL